MLSFKRLYRSSDRMFRLLLGVTRTEFDGLVVVFTKAVESDVESRATRSGRKRRWGAGRKPALTDPRDQLVFILLYVKQYPTQDLQALLFGKTQSWACEWVHRLMPLLQGALGRECHLPSRGPMTSIDELRSRVPGLEFVIDGTERPIARPSKEPRQREHYSGKTKRHTVKNVVVVDKKTKKIIHLSATTPGSHHDKRVTDEAGLSFPLGSRLFQDTGFQGYAPAGVTVLQPKKKPRNGGNRPIIDALWDTRQESMVLARNLKRAEAPMVR